MKAPQIGRVLTTDIRRVRIALGTEELIASQNGGRFRPDTLAAMYENGKVQYAVLGGPMIRADGKEHANGKRGRRLMSPDVTDAPDWVLELVERHRPHYHATATR